jgi:hypothetical protein
MRLCHLKMRLPMLMTLVQIAWPARQPQRDEEDDHHHERHAPEESGLYAMLYP